MKFFFPQALYNNSSRWQIFPLIKTLKKESNNVFNSLELVKDKSEADVIILPMSWNYYYRNNLIQDVLKLIYKEFTSGKPIISFVFGDIGCKVPKDFKGIVYRSSGRKSKLPNTHKGFPIFVEDPLQKYYSEKNIIIKPFSQKPSVGFCGLAHGFGIQTIKEILKTAIKNLVSFLGLSHRDLDQVMSTTYFRWKILNNLKKSDKIISNFIIRDSYRAGVKSDKDTHITTLQFYDNIKDSDYVVCMRGAGNFSTRFYETLAMGRIPVFINTDCLLPLEDKINWKHHVVWVEYNERHLIAEKILEFHKTLTETSINDLFLRNRKLWEDYLQLYPFFNATIYDY
ncbi:MAG TPA: exostosin family protein [Flavobacteriaceae bacterium]|nr:exostosin family protein [Flavobacteriaceae bacterium]